jgi:hypothetical protein
MIKVCTVQLYMLFVIETWFVLLRKECILREFSNSVMRKLDCNRDEVMERWMELLNYSCMPSPNDVM